MAAAPLVVGALGLALAGCQVRDDADRQPDEAPATATPTPTPSETAAASIIRDDALPGPIVKLPPDPLELTVPFAEGGADLTPRAESVLEGVLSSEQLDEGWPVVLRGHTDSDGNDRANLRASRARAEAVAAWLVEHGVADDRIEVVAMGEQNPIAPNALPDGSPNEAGRARNRRVDIEIAPADGAGPGNDPATPSGDDIERASEQPA